MGELSALVDHAYLLVARVVSIEIPADTTEVVSWFVVCRKEMEEV